MTVFYKTLGRNVKAARKACFLTQEQLADRLGISLLHYGRLERGERRASLERIAQIADVLGVSAYELLDGCFAGGAEHAASRCDAIAELAASCSEEGQRLIQDICYLIANDHDI